MDAFFLTVFTFIGFLIFPQIILSYPWVFLPIYALLFLLVVMFRRRQAARKAAEAQDEEQVSRPEYQATPLDFTAFNMIEGWMESKRRTPPEEY